MDLPEPDVPPIAVLVPVTAVALILDRSLSMPMNDFFYPARARAIELVDDLSQPGCPDHLQALIAFGAKAGVTDPADLPDLEFDYEYGSNLDAALRLVVASLNGTPGRLILISDLVASAHTGPYGDLVFSTPPNAETLDRTTDVGAGVSRPVSRRSLSSRRGWGRY
jgi:uncharacterized protein with von Willebrand factor type A (vWA) domain